MISPNIKDSDINWSKIGGDPFDPQSDLNYVGGVGKYNVEKVISKEGEYFEFACFDENRKIVEVEFQEFSEVITFLNKGEFDTP